MWIACQNFLSNTAYTRLTGSMKCMATSFPHANVRVFCIHEANRLDEMHGHILPTCKCEGIPRSNGERDFLSEVRVPSLIAQALELTVFNPFLPQFFFDLEGFTWRYWKILWAHVLGDFSKIRPQHWITAHLIK